jgi:uncharacterized protein (DUF1330 family)
MNQASGAFVIGSIRIKDTARWQQYRAAVPATLAPWHGEILLRGRRARVLSGETGQTDTVVIRFPNTAAVEGWYGSDAYAALIALRNEAAEVLLVSFEE